MRQLYLDPPPGGIDARWAWQQNGGRGRDIRIIDVEGDWRFTHEDLLTNQGGVLGGDTNGFAPDVSWRNHGTAVLGGSGDGTGIGVAGIASDAIASAVSHGGIGTAAAITLAASRLLPGDVLLLEMHRPGPRFGFATRADQRGYIAVEWWPDDFAAILDATSRGVVVVERQATAARTSTTRSTMRRRRAFRPSGPIPTIDSFAIRGPSWWAPVRRRRAPTARIMAPTGRASTSPTTARWSTRKAGAAK